MTIQKRREKISNTVGMVFLDSFRLDKIYVLIKKFYIRNIKYEDLEI